MNDVALSNRLHELKPRTQTRLARYQKGDRLKKTVAGEKTCVMPKGSKGTFIRYTRRGELLIHVDNYALSTCNTGWHPDFWERDA